MGVRAPAISKIRNGHTTITADFILKVHETFDIPIKEIKAMI
jgi:plasmid maintenance system antidote protein VapI